MAYRDLREFIAKLEKEGELRRVVAEVDPELEITEVTDRVTRMGGPALLFEHPKGSRVPLLINMLGSERRMNLALEVSDVDEVGGAHPRVPADMQYSAVKGLLDKLKMLPKLAELGSFFPKSVKTGPCKEVIRREGFSLSEFPILKCWPQDAGRFITWAAGRFSEASGNREAQCWCLSPCRSMTNERQACTGKRKSTAL